MDFLEWKFLDFDLNFTEICSQVYYWQYDNIGSDNDLVSKSHQA